VEYTNIILYRDMAGNIISDNFDCPIKSKDMLIY
jgi:hypothetical protein